MPSLKELLADAYKRIKPEDAEVILANLIGKTRAFIIGFPETRAETNKINVYKKMVTRRAAGVPLHYILGKREFYGIEFKIKPPILIPRPETETLIDAVLDSWATIGKPKPYIFDVGAGSGIIGITLGLKMPGSNIFLSDPDKKAIKLTKENIKLHKITARAKTKLGTYFNAWKKELKNVINKSTPVFIVANLPYVTNKKWRSANAEVKNYESKKALLGGGADGLLIYKIFFKKLAQIIPQTACQIFIAIELDGQQAEPMKNFIKKIFSSRLKNVGAFDTEIKKDLKGHKRVILVKIGLN